jgi:hypothetical protein
MGIPEIEAFLTQVAVVGQVAAKTQNQALTPSSSSIATPSNKNSTAASTLSEPATRSPAKPHEKASSPAESAQVDPTASA